MLWINGQALELNGGEAIVQAENLRRDGLQPVLAVCQVRSRDSATGTTGRPIGEIATGAHEATIRTEEGDIWMSGCESNHVPVRMHTHRRVLGVVSHIGKAPTGIDRTLN